MMRFLRYLLILVVFSSVLNSAQRSVLCEEVTATWCVYCPGAAMGLSDLKANYGDTVIIIAYHPSGSDPFYKYDAYLRAFLYYNAPGYPTVYFDGIDSVVGGSSGSSMYPYYKPKVDARKNIPSPVYFDLSCMYNPSDSSGVLEVKVINDTNVDVSAKLRIALILVDTPYNWQGMTHLEWVFYDMYPTVNGLSFTVGAGDTFIYNQDFTIPGEIANLEEVQLVVFAQNDYTHEVLNSWYINFGDFLKVDEGNIMKYKNKKVLVYPCEKHKVVLKLPEDGRYFVEFYDISGKRIWRGRLFSKGRYIIDVKNSGVYFYRISGKRNLRGKVAVK